MRIPAWYVSGQYIGGRLVVRQTNQYLAKPLSRTDAVNRHYRITLKQPNKPEMKQSRVDLAKGVPS